MKKLKLFVLFFALFFMGYGVSFAGSFAEAKLKSRRNELMSVLVRISPEYSSEDAYLRTLNAAKDGNFRQARNMLKTTLTVQPYCKNYALTLQVMDDILNEKLNQEEALWISEGLYLLAEKSPGAAGLFTKIIESRPEYPLAYYYRGAAHLADNPDSAVADLNKASALGLNSSEVHRLLAEAYVKKNSYQQALDQLDKATNLDKNNYQAFLDRAIIYSRVNFKDEAIADCNSAIRLNPVGVEAYELLARLYLDKKEVQEAVFDYVAAGDIYYYYLDTRCKARHPYRQFVHDAEPYYPVTVEGIKKVLRELSGQCK